MLDSRCRRINPTLAVAHAVPARDDSHSITGDWSQGEEKQKMPTRKPSGLSRRKFLAGCAGGAVGAGLWCGTQNGFAAQPKPKAQIAITMDLEMSRDYPQRGMREWDYEKGNLDEATKRYSVEAARLVRSYGGVIHFFCVGRTLEQPDVSWLKEIAEAGHPIGNHTYDHVNILARSAPEIQYRFQRSPWLIREKEVAAVIRQNIVMAGDAMQQRLGVNAQGFRTPGGFSRGLLDRDDLQQMLLELGFRWASALYPPHQSGKPMEPPGAEVYDDIVRAQQRAQPFAYESGLIEVPMSPISDVTAFRSHFWKREWFVEAISRAVEWAIEQGAVHDFLCHPSCMVVEDPEFETIRRMCELVKAAGDRAEIADLSRIAARVEQ
jgi:peptidoglycan/xylan/chitin deacetylase (PgdA/CDA1 family)